MRVLNISSCDYSNFGHMNALALSSVGVVCANYCLQKHKFEYKSASPEIRVNKLMQIAHKFDLIQVFHSDLSLLQFIPQGKRVFVYHTGTRYRQNPEQMNATWNQVAERCFYDSPEFAHLGAKNATYIATAIDTNHFAFSPSGNKKTLFAHYPSNPEVKGTESVVRVMKGKNFVWSAELVSSPENMKRMAGCDVYVEMLSPEQNGKPYGSFGVTAFEAAAMGKLVITNSAFHEVYESVYGKAEMLIANSEKELENASEEADGFLSDGGGYIRQWVCDNHSLSATGLYLKRFL